MKGSSVTVVQPNTSTTEKEQQQKEQPKKDEPPKTNKAVPFIQLYKFTTTKERIGIVVAIVCSMIAGFLVPFTIILYGSFLHGITDPSMKDNLLHSMYPTILEIVYTALGILISTYLSTLLWMRIGENQTHRLKKLYMRAVLYQEMSWFDKRKEDSLTTRLAEDTQCIKDGTSEKMGLFITYLTQYLTAVVIAFWKGEYNTPSYIYSIHAL